MSKEPGRTEKISGFSPGSFKQGWSLRNKILLSMVSLILLFGFSAALITRTILLSVLKTEFNRRSLSLARSIAANSVVDVLTQNTSRLNKLLDNEKELNIDTAYVFIVDSSGHMLAHTFEKGFPFDLLNANVLIKNKDFNAQLLDTQLGLIYDINVPILLDESVIGHVRLGILRSGIQKNIALIDTAIALITLFIILLNILLVNKISVLITRQISRLVQAAQSIQKGDFSAAKIDVKSRDEIGFLAATFNKMAVYLNQLVKDKEQLTKYKEREKIALDLHDNCAQDLSNLIKRLELCEKLFKIEPAKAYDELRALQENIRCHLGKARQIIRGFKYEEGEKIALAQKIKEYLDDFKQYNAVKAELNISSYFKNNISSEKASYIFYIITEALTNIKKHAQANNIEVSLDCNELEELAVNIKDDGKGFDVKQAQESASGFGKWGLMSMRQRALSLGGTLVINSIPGHGSEVKVRIPLNAIEYTI